ncbi:molybdopterin molybdotransferase MoeA [Larsenimonas salina]|uniref:molybdopterin molybdotransferase MoeA n=1 Tax=Larsenimonas salina TaxID=1295565 RepID=UPI00207373E3|nr:gephyrin-like molybdotransferase Glp [Larsenimonas salina]MCM5703505.1 molybdopterin molybdotransferase MoeA [Larsenimonas salina]
MGTDFHSVDAARAALLEGVTSLESEPCALDAAGGRVLAEDVHAAYDMPPFDNSAMDGYAVHSRDQGKTLAVSQRIPAGTHPPPLAPGTCARIFTGAPIPRGADSVIMQEHVRVDENGHIGFPDTVTPGNNVRVQGGEVAVDNVLLYAGTRLTPATLGVLASQGIAQPRVRRRPRVALLTSGDEVILPGTPIQPGQIYNSNRYQLAGLIKEFGGEIVKITHLPDCFEATCQALSEAAATADVLVTAGGVSVGEEDHVRHAIESMGTLTMWRLAMKPGKPLTIGRIGHASVVGLAGNPVSGFVGSYLFLRPLLGRLLACPTLESLPARTAKAAFSTKTASRRHYMRVTLDAEGDAHLAGSQDSSMLTSCALAEAFAVIEPDSVITPGDPIHCLTLPRS